MITVYFWDYQNVYSGSEELDLAQPFPVRCTLKEPPALTGTEVAVWRGRSWEVLPERPPVPDPVDPIPHEVEGWQAEVAMRATLVEPGDENSQNVWDRVQDLFAAMPDGIEKITAQTVLKRGKIRRDSPMLAQLAPMVPLTQERVDNLLRLADSIQA